MSDQSTSSVNYRPVPGFPHYRVGDDGSVWSNNPGRSKPTKPWKKLRLCVRKNGYLVFGICQKGKQETRYVHHAVLLSFGFTRPSLKHEVRHLNGNRADNRLVNLKWGTPKENQDDRVSHGTSNRGEKHGMSKLTPSDIHEIRYGRPLSAKEASEVFRISIANIFLIRAHKAWKHLP